MNTHICRRKNVFTIELAHFLYYLRFTMVTLFQRLIVVTCLLTGGLFPLAIKTEVALAQVTIAQTDLKTQAQQLVDEAMQLYKQGAT